MILVCSFVYCVLIFCCCLSVFGLIWNFSTELTNVLTLCIKQVTKENVLYVHHRELYSAHCGDLNGEEIRKGADARTCVADPSALQQKLTEHCEPTIRQEKIIKTSPDSGRLCLILGFERIVSKMPLCRIISFYIFLFFDCFIVIHVISQIRFSCHFLI